MELDFVTVVIDSEVAGEDSVVNGELMVVAGGASVDVVDGEPLVVCGDVSVAGVCVAVAG